MATKERTKEDIFEMFLRQAVIDCVHREAEEFAAMETPDEAEIASSIRAKKTRDLCLREDRRERLRRKTIPRLRRMAVAAAVALSVLTGSMLAYPAVRAAVADVFVEWFDQFTKFTGTGSQTNTMRQWELTYIPEGYAEVDRIESETLSVISLENEEGTLLTFVYQPDSGVATIDNEDMLYHEVLVDGVQYQIFESQDELKPSSIYWIRENYMFTLSGYIDDEFLLDIASSVK